MLQIGVVVCLSYLLFLWSAPMLGLCVLEKHIILDYLFFRDSPEDCWPCNGETATWLCRHVSSLNTRLLWIPYVHGPFSVALITISEIHLWELLLGMSSFWYSLTHHPGEWRTSRHMVVFSLHATLRIVIFPFKCQSGKQCTEQSAGHKSI